MMENDCAQSNEASDLTALSRQVGLPPALPPAKAIAKPLSRPFRDPLHSRIACSDRPATKAVRDASFQLAAACKV